MWLHSRFRNRLGIPGSRAATFEKTFWGWWAWGSFSFFIAFWAFDAFRTLNSQTLSAQRYTFQETKEWPPLRITIFRSKKTTQNDTSIWGWGHGFPETGSSGRPLWVLTNKVFIETGTQLWSQETKGARKTEAERWRPPEICRSYLCYFKKHCDSSEARTLKIRK